MFSWRRSTSETSGIPTSVPLSRRAVAPVPPHTSKRVTAQDSQEIHKISSSPDDATTEQDVKVQNSHPIDDRAPNYSDLNAWLVQVIADTNPQDDLAKALAPCKASADDLLQALEEYCVAAKDDPLTRQRCYCAGLELASHGTRPSADALVHFFMLAIADVWSATRKKCVACVKTAIPLENVTLQRRIFQHCLRLFSNEEENIIACSKENEESDAVLFWKAQDGGLLAVRACLHSFPALRDDERLDRAKHIAMRTLAHEQPCIRESALALAQTCVDVAGPRRALHAETLMQRALETIKAGHVLCPYHADGLLSLVEKLYPLTQNLCGLPFALQLLPLLGHEASTVRQACCGAVMASIRHQEVPEQRQANSLALLERLVEMPAQASWQEHEGRLFVIEQVLKELSEPTGFLSESAHLFDAVAHKILAVISRRACGDKFELQRMAQQICPLFVEVARRVTPETLFAVWARPDVDDWIRAETIQAYLRQALLPCNGTSVPCISASAESPAKEAVPQVLEDAIVRAEEVALLHSAAAAAARGPDVSLVGGLVMENLVLAMVSASTLLQAHNVNFHADQRRRIQVLCEYLQALREMAFPRQQRLQRSNSQPARSRSRSQGQCTDHSEVAEIRRRARNRYVGFVTVVAKYLPQFCQMLTAEERTWIAPFLDHWLAEVVHETAEQVAIIDAMLLLASCHPAPWILAKSVSLVFGRASTDLGPLGQKLVQCALITFHQASCGTFDGNPQPRIGTQAEGLLDMAMEKLDDCLDAAESLVPDQNCAEQHESGPDDSVLENEEEDEWDSWDEDSVDVGTSACVDRNELASSWRPLLDALSDFAATQN
ncbi:Hypothetical Protein FCC1311_040242 [Hondaea fermentalgiana]|uniref:Uncharacterized protein n=1 Tax=Hondaea fermentalgiana TaxID=2315210 RepID=A0A2R5GHN7_9STRA|nr:Hypothetical Protein FCC1311_040242 [Hondaea fermentalgiana]|eukprot:GBG27801.1 Hypothetical Protein FCC1311_040242 [Hondaea fermentalgiana]